MNGKTQPDGDEATASPSRTRADDITPPTGHAIRTFVPSIEDPPVPSAPGLRPGAAHEMQAPGDARSSPRTDTVRAKVRPAVIQEKRKGNLRVQVAVALVVVAMVAVALLASSGLRPHHDSSSPTVVPETQR